MNSRTTASLVTTLLLTVAACATQNAGAGFDEPMDEDDMMDIGGSPDSGKGGKGGTGISISGSTSIAGSAAGKGGSTSLPPAGSGGKGGTGSGGKGGKGGSGGGTSAGTGGMDAAGGSDDGPTNMPIAGLSVTFKPESTADNYDFIGGELAVVNDTAQPLDYATLKVRYYFTNEFTAVMPTTSMNWAVYGPANNNKNTTCTGELVKLPAAKAEADSYIELTCDAPGTLSAGSLLKISWKSGQQPNKFIQSNDWSFKNVSNIVVIDGNNIVWGVEP